MTRITSRLAGAALAMAAVGGVFVTGAASAETIEPRSLTWNIVSDQEMSSLCRRHGQNPSCAGLAAWDEEFQSCIIWTRSPRSADDLQRWRLVHHELRHCQQGAYHS